MSMFCLSKSHIAEHNYNIIFGYEKNGWISVSHFIKTFFRVILVVSFSLFYRTSKSVLNENESFTIF